MLIFFPRKRLILFAFLLLNVCPYIQAEEKGLGKFIFAGQVGEGFEIYVVNDDGTGEKKITSTDGKASNPKWCPDGKSFGFINNDHLEFADESGKTIRRVNPVVGVIQDFDWSPDGKKIAFNSYAMPVSTKICLEDVSTSKIRCLADRKIWCGNLAWAPDGQKIAFVENAEPDGDQIVVLDSNSGAELIKTKLKDDVKVAMPNRGDGFLDANLLNIGWTSNSKKIHFESFGGKCWNYFLTLMTGKYEKWGKEDDQDLNWTLEGETAVFQGGFAPEVYSADLKGRNRKQLTPSGHYSGHPLLIKNGNMIAYLSNRGKDLETVGGKSIFVMNLDGSSQKRISNIKMEESKSEYSWHFFEN